jgi:hypothetical protein
MESKKRRVVRVETNYSNVYEYSPETAVRYHLRLTELIHVHISRRSHKSHAKVVPLTLLR